MKILLLCFVTIFVLAGCGQAPDAPATTPPTTTADNQSTKPLTEAQLGVKFYPGARVVTSGETDSVLSANLETSDPSDKAVAFYENELGAKSDGGSPVATISGKKGAVQYAISITTASGVTSISILGKK